MRRIAVSIAAFGVLCLAPSIRASLAAEQNSPGPAAQRVATPGILVIAHRGDSRVAPENTLPAFVSAVKAGADFVGLV